MMMTTMMTTARAGSTSWRNHPCRDRGGAVLAAQDFFHIQLDLGRVPVGGAGGTAAIGFLVVLGKSLAWGLGAALLVSVVGSLALAILSGFGWEGGFSKGIPGSKWQGSTDPPAIDRHC